MEPANLQSDKKDQLITGNQLKAARALAGVDQLSIAKASKVSVNTIRNMESWGPNPITSGAATVRNVRSALEGFGVEFTYGDQPGVRLRKAQ
jgi:transcriptional regulator with XRE-family HTH domain